MIAHGYRVVGSVQKAAMPQVERLVGATGLAALINNAGVAPSMLPVFR